MHGYGVFPHREWKGRRPAGPSFDAFALAQPRISERCLGTDIPALVEGTRPERLPANSAGVAAGVGRTARTGVADLAGDVAGTGRGVAVWCDFGGVLTSPVDDAFGQVVAAAGVPVGPLRAAVEAVAAAHGLTGLGPLELGLVSQRDWGAQVHAALAPAWTPAVDLGRVGEYWYAGRGAEEQLLARLAELPGTGVRLGMLTNAIREWEAHRRALLPAAFRVFERRINSFEVGVRKPDPAIYELAEGAFGRAGADCLLIDDVEANCAAARRRGWSAIRHVSAVATIAELDAWLAGRPDVRRSGEGL